MVPVGSAEIFFNSNKRLTQEAPTTFTNDEIVNLARAAGFIPIAQNIDGYSGTAFFVAFEKPR